MFEARLPATFVAHAADVLGDTNRGLSGDNIVKAMRAYAVEYGVNVPHAIYPFQAGNKRTALFENLQAFSAPQQHRILRELCEHRNFGFKESPERRQIRAQLATIYREYDTETGASTVNEALVDETRHWLDVCPQALSLYNEAIGKYRSGLFQRNVLDDLRLALELLLKTVFENGKSLENQVPALGQFIKARGGSPQLANMFAKLVDYYAHYQNDCVKHADAVIETEIEFILEITSSFMKHVVRMNADQT